MGARCRSHRSIREAFHAEAERRESARPGTRPRVPPVANMDHTAPLWSEHLKTYVSYSWEERQWKRWDTTVKLWEVIVDIDAVIGAESEIHKLALAGEETMPPKPQEPGWSEPLWFQTEYLFVSYNSKTGEWKEWSKLSENWEAAEVLGPTMPVAPRAERPQEASNTDQENAEKAASRKTTEERSTSEIATQNAPAASDVPEKPLKTAKVGNPLRRAFRRWLA